MKRKKDLRKNYMLHLQVGMISSLLVFLFVFRMNYQSEAPQLLVVDMPEEVYMEEIIQTKQVNTPPPPPRPPVPVEVPNDEIIEDEILDLDAELDLDEAIELPPPPPSQNYEDMEDEIFVVVENPPELIGGIGSVQRRIKYPEIARNAGIEGRVIVQFIVDEEGEIVNPKVVRGIGGGCDEAALKALDGAKFKPGRQRGKPVKVSYSMPITFSLTGS